MHVALGGEEALVARRHAREGVADKVGLRIVVPAAHDVVDRAGVGRHESAAADEAAVDEGGAVLGSPAGDEPVVLLVVHLAQVAHEERGRGRAWKVSERRACLAEDEHEECPGEVEGDEHGEEQEDEERRGGHAGRR